jgi:very-short-patch-repair endonuclease
MGGKAQLSCRQLAERQRGVIRREQALSLGLTRREIDRKLSSGQWVVVLPCVYRVAGSLADWRQQLKAVALWAARDYAFSHRTAAALWGLARFGDGPVELTVARDLRLAPPVVVHRAAFLSSRDTRSIEHLRVTSPTRTLLDLCAEEDTRSIHASLDELLRRELTSLRELDDALERLGKRRGIAQLKDILGRYADGECATESELEAVAFDAIDSAGLPRPTKQVQMVVDGRLRRLDFIYSNERVIIEADSRKHHYFNPAFESDKDRDNGLTAKGHYVLHWTWKALKERPDKLAEQLQGTLEQRQRELGLTSAGAP